MWQSPIVRSVAPSLIWVAVGIAVALPLYIWGSDKAPEFYGAFVAAIVAAVAVILGSYYQAELTRRRDDVLREQDKIACAVDLYFWMENAADEMDFIASMLDRMQDRLVSSGEEQLSMPLGQFREIVTARFMDELLARARIASRMPPSIAAPITKTLYLTFRAVDRVYHYRGAVEHYKPGQKQLEQQIFISRARADRLREACDLLGSYLVAEKALHPSTIVDEDEEAGP
jgi:hypothetical protein